MRQNGMYQGTPKYANKRRSTSAASKVSMDDKTAVNAEMLNSWKEVAVYLGRGVRTVQRWELDLGLPVRRPRGKPRSAVIALKAELDSWLTGSQAETASKEIIIRKPIKKTLTMAPRAQSLHSNTQLLMSKTRQVLERSVDLCTQSQQLCEQMKRVLVTTAKFATIKSSPPPAIMQQSKAATTNS